jgi:2-polyprenyl-3-methyl-5-hydroxy-6-metoxy-1,4-benzoquinol methylase
VSTDDPQRAKSYFDDLAPEYNRAFEKSGGDPLSAVVNRFFRGRTFERRMRQLEELFRDLGVAGRSVLDLGCGSGQVSILAAKMGATVHAVDIAPGMLRIAQETAAAAGVSDRIRFEAGDVAGTTYDPADLVLLVGVTEYYADHRSLMARAAKATRGRLVVAHTTRVLYRMLLRRALFAMKGSNLYFHPMADVIRSGADAGLRLDREIKDHAFSILVFGRA